MPETMMRPPGAPAEWSTYNPWDPRFSTTPDDLEWEFDLDEPGLTEADFSPVLRPLYRHRAKMTMLEGLAMLSTSLDRYGDGHAKGHIGALCATVSSGSPDGTRSRSATASIDQRINEFLQQEDPGHFSLEYRAYPNRNNEALHHAFLYRSDGAGGATVLPTESDPDVAFRRLFPGTGGDTVDPRVEGRRSILSLVRSQYTELAPRMNGEDRLRLEQHRDYIADLERQLGTSYSCDDPTAPASVAGLDTAATHAADFDAFSAMIAAAFSCRVSRVATLGMFAPTEAFGLPVDEPIHHSYEHPSDPFHLLGFYDGNRDAQVAPEAAGGDGVGKTYGECVDGMVDKNAYQAETLARLLDRLDAIPEGDGTLLDHTLVVYVTELSHGGHGHEHYPIVLFGGGSTGVVTPGRYIKYAQNNPNPFGRNYFNQYTGTPHNLLYNSICQAFGMDLDYLWQPSVTGTLPVTREISLSGPLPRLRQT